MTPAHEVVTCLVHEEDRDQRHGEWQAAEKEARIGRWVESLPEDASDGRGEDGGGEEQHMDQGKTPRWYWRGLGRSAPLSDPREAERLLGLHVIRTVSPTAAGSTSAADPSRTAISR